MVIRIYSTSIIGLEAKLIEIEVVVVNGLPLFSIVGLVSTAVKESKERVYSAIKSSGYKFPQIKKIINLSPANLPKTSTCYDLGIAYGLLIASGEVDSVDLNNIVILGELSLDGTVRPVTGVLPSVLHAKKKGFESVIVPIGNLKEASIISGIKILGVGSLSDLIMQKFIIPPKNINVIKVPQAEVDFSDINGQAFAKRALEVSAAGGHNIAFIGPAGSGKSMLAKAFAGILPPLSLTEAIDVAKVFSITNRIDTSTPLKFNRPFRTVHHSASMPSIVGGGKNSNIGEVTLANHGVLFFDELAEFQRSTLESLRQPLEDRKIHISRVNYSITYPADFIFLAAYNPCPCGNANSLKKECVCSAALINRYQRKISGPLLDRIDLFIALQDVPAKELIIESKSETSSSILKRVISARKIQKQRYKNINTNSQMTKAHIKKFCQLSKNQELILKNIIEKYNLSARAYFRLLKVMRTIADLDNSTTILNQHVFEAIQYRHERES